MPSILGLLGVALGAMAPVPAGDMREGGELSADDARRDGQADDEPGPSVMEVDQEPDAMAAGGGSVVLQLSAQGGLAASIDDFDPARDALVVLYDGAGGPPALGCAVDEEGATLLADGEPIARLRGVGAIDLSTVRLSAC